MYGRAETHSKPMCECIMIVAPSMASVTGFNDPAANGAIVKGTRATETSYEFARILAIGAFYKAWVPSWGLDWNVLSQMSSGRIHGLDWVRERRRRHLLVGEVGLAKILEGPRHRFDGIHTTAFNNL